MTGGGGALSHPGTGGPGGPLSYPDWLRWQVARQSEHEPEAG